MDPTNQLIDVLARSYLSPEGIDVLSANTSVFTSRAFANGTGSHGDPQILVEKAPLRTCPAISVNVLSCARSFRLPDRDHLRCAFLTTQKRRSLHTTIMTIRELSILRLGRTRNCLSISVVNL